MTRTRGERLVSRSLKASRFRPFAQSSQGWWTHERHPQRFLHRRFGPGARALPRRHRGPHHLYLARLNPARLYHPDLLSFKVPLGVQGSSSARRGREHRHTDTLRKLYLDLTSFESPVEIRFALGGVGVERGEAVDRVEGCEREGDVLKGGRKTRDGQAVRSIRDETKREERRPGRT